MNLPPPDSPAPAPTPADTAAEARLRPLLKEALSPDSGDTAGAPLRMDEPRRAALLEKLGARPRVIPFWSAFLAVSREYGFAQVAAVLFVALVAYTFSSFYVVSKYVEAPQRADDVVFSSGAGGGSGGERAKAYEHRMSSSDESGRASRIVSKSASASIYIPAGDGRPATSADGNPMDALRERQFGALPAAPAPATRSMPFAGSGGGEGSGIGIGKGGGRNFVSTFGAKASEESVGSLESNAADSAGLADSNSAVAEAKPAKKIRAWNAPTAEPPPVDAIPEPVTADIEPVPARPEQKAEAEAPALAGKADKSQSTGNLDDLSIRAQADTEADYVVRGKERSDKDLRTRITSDRPAADKMPVIGDLPIIGKLYAPASPAKPAEPAAPAAPRDISAEQNPFSTFSLNVSDAAFRIAAAANSAGHLPAPATIRAEEFVNSQVYLDPKPRAADAFGIACDNAAHPFVPGRQLVRVSLSANATGRAPTTPLNLVVALDNSGSMERADRRETTTAALNTLADKLGPADIVSVVGFSRTQNLLVDRARGPAAAAELRHLAANAGTPEGGTNLEGALNTAFAQLAAQTPAKGAAINRVVLLTDGATNLGVGEPEKLAAIVEANRKQGRALDCFGIGLDGYDDAMLERLARNGDGRYAFLNDAAAVRDGFAEKLAGALRPAARDVKVQLEFNPDRVASWRLIGYDKHRLTKEQFRDNTVDAAELAAAESGTAVYVIEPKPDGRGHLAIARVRYLDPATGLHKEEERVLPFVTAPAFDAAPANARLAAVAALTGEVLGDAPEAVVYDTAVLARAARRLAAEAPADAKRQTLRQLAEAAARKNK